MSSIIFCQPGSETIPADTLAAVKRAMQGYTIYENTDAVVAPGEDFVEAIETAIDAASAVIVVIPAEGLAALQDEFHYDRIALRRALEKKLKILPVLLPGASRPSDLPEDIKAVARRASVEVGMLTSTLQDMLKKPVASPTAEIVPQAKSSSLTPRPAPRPAPQAAAPARPVQGEVVNVDLALPSMIVNIDPRARAKISSTSGVVKAMRSPSFNSQPITLAANGKRYPVVGRDAAGQWYQLLVDGIPGWVSVNSLRLLNTENVQVTKREDGGLPSAQEVYFMVALKHKRDAVKKRSATTRRRLFLSDHFLNETVWVEQSTIPMVPASRLDPELMTPAEGAVGIYERQIAKTHSGWRNARRLYWVAVVLGWIIGLSLMSAASSEETSTSATTSSFRSSATTTETTTDEGTAALASLVLLATAGITFGGWMIGLVQESSFNHKRYHTKQQAAVARAKQGAVGAAAIGSAVAAVGVAYAANRANQRGEKFDFGNVASMAAKGLDIAAKAAPAAVVAGGAIAAKTHADNLRNERAVQSDAQAIAQFHTFISYRRADTLPIAEQLFEALTARFATNAVFLDRDGIPPGADFRDVLRKRVSTARTIVALIGPYWAVDENGRNRINEANDWVRFEIAESLRQGKEIIPVLCQFPGLPVNMPSPEQLPSELTPFTYKNAVFLAQGKETEALDKIQQRVTAVVARDYRLLGDVDPTE